jgi:uncharacterized repeat protein (TIGR01451 family)
VLGPATSYRTGSGAWTVVIGDLDGKAPADVVVANQGAGTIAVFLGTRGGPHLVARYRVGPSPTGLAIGDFDGDRRPDLAVADYSEGRLRILRGLGQGRLGSAFSMPGGRELLSIAAGDFDGDLRLDLAALGGNAVHLFRNVTPMADLAVTLDNGDTSVRPGETVQYTLSVTNNGPEAAPLARVRLKLPPWITAVSWTCSASPGSSCPAAGSGARLDQTISLEPGGSAAFEVVVLVPPRAGSCLVADASVRMTTLTDPRADNDRASDVDGVQPTLVVRGKTVREGPLGSMRKLRFLLTLNHPTCGEVTAQYSTADGSATVGEDYEAVSGVIAFPPGTTTRWVDVLVRGDALDEPDEAVKLLVSEVTEATPASTEGIGTIRDDDPAP